MTAGMQNKGLENILDKIVIEELSHISINETEAGIELQDELRDKGYLINKVMQHMCRLINGKRTLLEIAHDMSQSYQMEQSLIEQDIYDIYKFMKRNKLIITKNSLYYKYMKIYYKVSMIKMGGEYVSQ